MGASDIAAAATGLYGGAYKAVASKLGIDLGEIDPDTQFRFHRGHRWEQPIADSVRALFGLAVYGEQALLRRPAEPRIHVTLDGLLGPADLDEPTLDGMTATLEVKTRDRHARPAWDYYCAQAQVGMWVTGMPRCLLAVATIEDDYHDGRLSEGPTRVEYRWVDADPFEQERLVELGLELWGHVERGELPEPTDPTSLPMVKAANASAGIVCPDCFGDGKHRGGGRRKRCERCSGKGIANVEHPPALDDLAELLARTKAIESRLKALSEEHDLAQARLRHRLGEAVEATTSDGRWRVRCGLPVRKFTSQSETDFLDLYGDRAAELGLTRTVLDRDAAKAAMPDEYDLLRRSTTDRRLTITDTQPED
jgi:hypothetical protein